MSWGKRNVHSMRGAVPLKGAGTRHVEGNIQFDGGSCRAMLTRSEITFTVCQAPRHGVISGQSVVLGGWGT